MKNWRNAKKQNTIILQNQRVYIVLKSFFSQKTVQVYFQHLENIVTNKEDKNQPGLTLFTCY